MENFYLVDSRKIRDWFILSNKTINKLAADTWFRNLLYTLFLSLSIPFLLERPNGWISQMTDNHILVSFCLLSSSSNQSMTSTIKKKKNIVLKLSIRLFLAFSNPWFSLWQQLSMVGPC